MAPKNTKAAAALKTVFKVDYSKPVADSIFDAAEFEKYLHDRIKVEGKTGQLADKVTLKRDASKLTITSTIPFSKRQIKYLTKKFIQKSVGSGFMRVVATSKDTYTLTYPNVADEEAEDAEDL
ncbi:60s ribosomal protein l22 [Phaffia rhodozyma]|uniref:Large ribosomal subunit protein eL22 n=1 Tax=Phaffia rhodozyma TaxID=264483 RepID=A0A0F7SG15_PHARH|nr:60s ribosomal protein l22 [Phaffia rhodozyma]